MSTMRRTERWRRDLARLVRHRWPVLLVGALLTTLAVLAVDRDRAVYYTRGEVTFLAPSSRLYPNSLSTTSEGLIITAGVIAKELTGPGRVLKLASPDVDLVGLGVRNGWTVRLPDTGGQWAPNFAEQQLVVEVVGPDPDVVVARALALVESIRVELDDFQRDTRVDPVNDITVKLTPDAAGVRRVGGSRVRALGMTVVLGVAATVLVAGRTRPARSHPQEGERHHGTR